MPAPTSAVTSSAAISTNVVGGPTTHSITQTARWPIASARRSPEPVLHAEARGRGHGDRGGDADHAVVCPQAPGGVLGRQHAQLDPGAHLQPGGVGQAGQHVDPPAEHLRAARRGAHPQVERRDPAELGGQPAAARRAAARRTSGPSSSNRGLGVRGAICTWKGDVRGERADGHALGVDRHQPLAALDLLLHHVAEQVAALGAVAIGGEPLALARDGGGHERQRVELGVGVRQRGPGRLALVHDHVHVARLRVRADPLAPDAHRLRQAVRAEVEQRPDRLGPVDHHLVRPGRRARGEQLRLAAARLPAGSLDRAVARPPARGTCSAPPARASPARRARRRPAAARRPPAGVWSSWPSQERVGLGVDHGARGGVDERARAGAALARDDHAQAAAGGRCRSSGKGLLHRDVLDALLEEDLAHGPRSRRARRASGPSTWACSRMRAAPAAAETRSASSRIAAPIPRPRSSGSTAIRPEAPDAVLDDHAAGADQPPVAHRDQVERLAVAAVAVGRRVTPCSPHEHAVAQRQRGVDLGGASRTSPDLDLASVTLDVRRPASARWRSRPASRRPARPSSRRTRSRGRRRTALIRAETFRSGSL